MEWRTFGYEGYEVSETGKVRRLPREVNGPHGQTRFLGVKELSLCPDKDGYMRVYIQPLGYGRQINISVSRAVCTAFRGPPPSAKHEAAHRDHNNKNNHKDNLIWATGTENMAQSEQCGWPNGRPGRAPAPFSTDDITEMKRLAALPHYSYSDIAGYFKTSKGTIWRLVNG